MRDVSRRDKFQVLVKKKKRFRFYLFIYLCLIRYKTNKNKESNKIENITYQDAKSHDNGGLVE